MMHNSRFSFGDGEESRLIEEADCLKIHLFRQREGKLCVHFELSGDLGFEDEEDGAVANRTELGFVRELISRFERVKD